MKHRSNIAKHLLLLLLPGLLAWQAQAQTSLVLELDTPVIRIGEQLHARMILNGRGNPDHYRLPVFYDTLVKGIEVLEQSATDTIQHEDGYFRISRDLLITSFDSGDYLIGPLMALQVQGRDTLTIKASPVQLSVFSVTLEDSEEIRDIHGPFKVPLTWKEIYPWVLAVIALGLLLWGIRWYLRARKSGKPLISLLSRPPLPPHIRALDAFESLRKRKLWQEGRIKEYHSELTGILRTYLDERFGIPAMEMVSWEIMDALEDLHDIDRDKLHLLHEMFTLADMVKFAKASPLPDENERCLRAAADFVRATIPSANEAQDTKGIPHTNSEPSDTDNKA